MSFHFHSFPFIAAHILSCHSFNFVSLISLIAFHFIPFIHFINSPIRPCIHSLTHSVSHFIITHHPPLIAHHPSTHLPTHPIYPSIRSLSIHVFMFCFISAHYNSCRSILISFHPIPSRTMQFNSVQSNSFISFNSLVHRLSDAFIHSRNQSIQLIQLSSLNSINSFICLIHSIKFNSKHSIHSFHSFIHSFIHSMQSIKSIHLINSIHSVLAFPPVQFN